MGPLPLPQEREPYWVRNLLPESLYWEHLVAGKLKGAERRPWAKWRSLERQKWSSVIIFFVLHCPFCLSPPQLLLRRFSALEHGIQPFPAQRKIEELERELETEMGQEPEPEPEPQLEPEPRQL